MRSSLAAASDRSITRPLVNGPLTRDAARFHEAVSEILQLLGDDLLAACNLIRSVRAQGFDGLQQ